MLSLNVWVTDIKFKISEYNVQKKTPRRGRKTIDFENTKVSKLSILSLLITK